MRGLHEYQIDGVTRGFLMNFGAFAILEENTNMPFDEIVSKLAEKGGRSKVKLLSEFFFAGAINYCGYKGVQQDFSRHEVESWISEIGIGEATRIVTLSLHTSTPKNSVPLS
jgi:hypothetical protein